MWIPHGIIIERKEKLVFLCSLERCAVNMDSMQVNMTVELFHGLPQKHKLNRGVHVLMLRNATALIDTHGRIGELPAISEGVSLLLWQARRAAAILSMK